MIGGAIVVGPEKIDGARLLVLRSALHLETLGMKRRGPSVLSIVKQEFGITGHKLDVYQKFDAYVTEVTGIRKGGARG